MPLSFDIERAGQCNRQEEEEGRAELTWTAAVLHSCRWLSYIIVKTEQNKRIRISVSPLRTKTFPFDGAQRTVLYTDRTNHCLLLKSFFFYFFYFATHHRTPNIWLIGLFLDAPLLLTELAFKKKRLITQTLNAKAYWNRWIGVKGKRDEEEEEAKSFLIYVSGGAEEEAGNPFLQAETITEKNVYKKKKKWLPLLLLLCSINIH